MNSRRSSPSSDPGAGGEPCLSAENLQALSAAKAPSIYELDHLLKCRGCVQELERLRALLRTGSP